MSHRNLKYLNDNRIIYRRYSSDVPTTSFSWGWYYKDGTHGYYAMFNSKAKITSIRSLKWHLLTLWYLNPDMDKDKFTLLAEYICYKQNGFITFSAGNKLTTKIIEDVYKQDLENPPKNRLRKIVFKDSSGLTTIKKLQIVGKIIGQAKGIKEDDIYEAMLYLHEQGKITVSKLAKALNCTNRTIYRHMGKELKLEKQLLNKENEKI
jgi:hypothetical protein